MIAEQAKAGQGIPVPARSWKLGPYLDYRLENVIKPTRRPATYALYEINIRVHLRPGLRSLNIVTAAALVLGEALRQTGGLDRLAATGER